jgi:hypothetical protein
MSFKPELFEDEEGKKLPLALESELFILQRAKITFQCKTPEYVRVAVWARLALC